MSLLKNEAKTAKDEYYKIIAGEEEGNRGLVIWMRDLIKESVKSDWNGYVFVGSRRWQKMSTKGIFPSIMIIPLTDSWESASVTENVHSISVNVVSAVRGKRDYTFWKTIEYTSELHDLFRTKVPEHDKFKKKPYDGETKFAWEYLANEWLGVSRLSLTYEFQLSIS